MLEKKLAIQTISVEELKSEVNRLKIENEFLTKTISLLADKNKELTQQNRVMQEEKRKIKLDFDSLKLKYEALAAENNLLKAKVLSVGSKEDKRAALPIPTPSVKLASKLPNILPNATCGADLFNDPPKSEKPSQLGRKSMSEFSGIRMTTKVR